MSRAKIQKRHKNPKTLSGIETLEAQLSLLDQERHKNPKTLSGIETWILQAVVKLLQAQKP